MSTITVPTDGDDIITSWGAAVANAINGGPTGTWTPVLTFATPGTLSVTYAIQQGWYYQIGRLVIAGFRIQTSAFSKGTASGNLRVTGLPFTPVNSSNINGTGGLVWRGLTKANFTHLVGFVAPNDPSIYAYASGSGQTPALITASDTLANPIDLVGTVIYLAAS